MRALACVFGLLLLVAADAAGQEASRLSGMSSAEIKVLQQRLSADGCYQDAIDGKSSGNLENAIKACPDQKPVLRIETGLHQGPVWRVAADTSCKLLATGSQDKTVRLWSLPSGKFIRTLRPPIGPGNLGVITVVAMSPNGQWVAASGDDSFKKVEPTTGAYVFNAGAGIDVRRLGNFPEGIDRMAFSADGTRLAVASGGVTLFDARDWKRLAAVENKEGISDVGFGPTGEVYAIAKDGRLWRFSAGLLPLASNKIAGGRLPRSLAVDPTGRHLAVSFSDTTSIALFDARTLHQIGQISSSGQVSSSARGGAPYLAGPFVQNGQAIVVKFNANPGEVVWSGDGQRLYATGIALRGLTIRTFDAVGRVVGEDIPFFQGTITSLAPCGNQVVFGTSNSGFGVIRDKQVVLLADEQGKLINTHANSNHGLLVSANGKRLLLELPDVFKTPVEFDLDLGVIAVAGNPKINFRSPDTTSLPISGWGTVSPLKLAGKKLENDPGDVVQSLAIRPDKAGLVAGTLHKLRAFTAEGAQVWEREIASPSWAANFASEGKLIVVGLSDGTIRWYRWSDGKEILTLFVDVPSRRWTAWTPSGYYMASPGGEDLIGWEVNRGWNQSADFFPASRFRDRFNRPDIVRLALTTLDEDEAIKQANEAARRKTGTQPLIEHLPPVIRISGPADGAHVVDNTVTLEYAVRSPSGQPIERLDLLINGRPVKSYGLPAKPLSPDVERTGPVQVTLTQHVSEFGLIAWSGDLSSQAAHIQVTWDGAPEVTRKLFALVIGVSNYADPAMTLKFAAKDAGDFATALAAQKGLYYTDVQTRVLTNPDVTRASVIEGLQWLAKMATNPNDMSVLFLAGHGMTDNEQTYWFYTSDSNDGNVLINGVSQDEFRKLLQGIPGKVLWFLDTCHAGAAAKRSPVDMNVLVNAVRASENGGIVVFASSTGSQVSVESADLGNGAFTKALVEGIKLGKADLLSDGFITTSTLDSYVAHRVEQFSNDQQTPVMERPPEQPDFTIAEVRK